jgi:uncharacterized membrane protein
MHFAYPVPWSLALLLAAAIAAAVLVEYRRRLAPLTRVQRGVLAALRALTLLSLVLFFFRPIAMLPPAASRGAVVPVLVDTSRSMRIADADGASRIAAASMLLKTRLMPALTSSFTPALYAFGDGLSPIAADKIAADARRTDLSGALAAVRERYRGQRVAGIVVLSDGADTDESAHGTAGSAKARSADGPPVFAIGFGSVDGPRDREVVGVTAGDPRVDQSSIDLHVTARSSGFGRTPFQLQVLANGQSIESRRLVPSADGSPIDAVFTVSPNPTTPTVYTAQIAADEGEPVTENNQRSVLVGPSGRKRRVLVIEGAPGFEHSFMTRAWSADPGLEVDTVTRKGKNADGQDTFFVQAGAGRAAWLTGGFPSARDKLFFYDAIVIANVESDFFTRAQLQLAADFVSERGGGLLVLGGRSFTQRGLSGTPLEEVLPVELNDRRGAVLRPAGFRGEEVPGYVEVQPHNKVTLTSDGERHPVMRIGATPEETRKLWTAMPALAASAPLGGPRPGATVLALIAVPGGGLHPVVAVQRYGHGRSMVFAGEASWRWKMMVASTDRSYEFFWRQAARWLTTAAPDPVVVGVPDAAEPGDSIPIEVDARDGSYAPVPDAAVEATITPPGGGAPQTLKLRHADPAGGQFAAAVTLDRPGLIRVQAEAKRGSQSLGAADRWMYVGGADREFTDPRLNEALLRRVARESGGRYARPADAAHVIDWLKDTIPQTAAPERRDLWHEPWAFALVAMLICAEWILRRSWGLR